MCGTYGVKNFYFFILFIFLFSACEPQFNNPGKKQEAQAPSSTTKTIFSSCDPNRLPYAAGSGTITDPYIICSARQFQEMVFRNEGHKVFKLASDIDLSPLTEFKQFSIQSGGVLDCSGYTIKGLKSEQYAIYDQNTLYQTDFIYFNYGTIKNCTFDSFSLNGSLVMNNSNLIQNIKIQNSIFQNQNGGSPISYNDQTGFVYNLTLNSTNYLISDNVNYGPFWTQNGQTLYISNSAQYYKIESSSGMGPIFPTILETLDNTWWPNRSFVPTELNTTNPPDKLLTVKNTTLDSIKITGFSLIDNTQFHIINGGTCAINTQLSPNQSCTIKIQFAPQGDNPYVMYDLLSVSYINTNTQEAFTLSHAIGAQAKNPNGFLTFYSNDNYFNHAFENTQIISTFSFENPSQGYNIDSIDEISLYKNENNIFTIQDISCVGNSLPGWWGSCNVEITLNALPIGFYGDTVKVKYTISGTQYTAYFDLSVNVIPLPFAGGSGSCSPYDPYLIATPTHFKNIKNYANSGYCFKQTQDIDLGYDINNCDNTENFYIPYFTGEYDGNGYKISNYCLNVNNHYIGLFGYIQLPSKIQNLTLENFNITGPYNVGALFGYANWASLISNITLNNITINSINPNSTFYGYYGGLGGYASYNLQISNITINNLNFNTNYSNTVGGVLGSADSITLQNINVNSAQVIGKNYVGGIVGQARWSQILNASFNGTITGTGTMGNDGSIGGIAGYTDSSNVISSINYGTINAIEDNVGGIVGGAGNNGSVVQASINLGTITGGQGVGGIVGSGLYSPYCNRGSIYTSVNLGNIIGQTLVGGITGANCGTISDSYVGEVTITANDANGSAAGFTTMNYPGASISNSYSKALNVTSPHAVAGFVVSNYGTLNSIYYHDNGSVPTDSYATARTTEQLTDPTNFSGFNFSNPWRMPSSIDTNQYPAGSNTLVSPVLFWQCGTLGITCP